MGLSDGHLFLIAADQAAKGHDYFQWRSVGRNLEWAEAKSREVLISLGGRKLVIVLSGEETRLLPAGRALAQELRVQEARRVGDRPRLLRQDGDVNPRPRGRG